MSYTDWEFSKNYSGVSEKRTSEPQHHADVLRALIAEHERRRKYEDNGSPFLIDEEIVALWFAIGTLEGIAHPIRPGD